MKNIELQIMTAAECRTMSDIRREIDRLDRSLVSLLAERLAYISRAGMIKVDRNSVYDEVRINDVVKKIRAEAERRDLQPDLAEAVWRELMRLCILYEYQVFDAKRV